MMLFLNNAGPRSVSIAVLFSLVFVLGCKQGPQHQRLEETQTAGNPIFEGWYADPEGAVFDREFWVYPTYSDDFEKQLHLDAFSSKDLIHWTKHERILDTTKIQWLRQALWAPSIIEKDDRYYLFFGANDIQRPGRPSYDPKNDINHYGGIGVAVGETPAGPFKDYLGQPLISDFYNEAQPIDQFVFEDVDGTFYFFYGGWGHCNLGVLNADFTGFVPWEDGQLFQEITPEGYVEGPFMFLRNHIYYFMWSEGNWTDGSYKVAYAMAEKATGPYKRVGTVLESDGAIASGAGHHSAINVPGTDDWIMVYHRRPIPNKDRDHRVTCMDKMEFRADGTIKPITMTHEGVQGVTLQEDNSK